MEDPFPPLTEAEARQLKERNQRWVKRVVALVALVLTVSVPTSFMNLFLIRFFRQLPLCWSHCRYH